MKRKLGALFGLILFLLVVSQGQAQEPVQVLSGPTEVEIRTAPIPDDRRGADLDPAVYAPKADAVASSHFAPPIQAQAIQASDPRLYFKQLVNDEGFGYLYNTPCGTNLLVAE